MKTLGIIPARNGSKRIPQKHFEVIGGKRLIDWTIDAALASNLDSIVLSTDIPDLSNLYQFALQAPERRQDSLRLTFLERPPALAEDNIHVVEVVLDILENYSGEIPYDAIMLLLPTSPFRTADDIDKSLRIMTSGADAVIGVQRLPYPDVRLRFIDTRIGTLYHPYLDSRQVTVNSQECKPLYLVNGAIFVTSPSALLTWRTFHVDFANPYIMPPERSIEIDTPEDLVVAREMCCEAL